MVEKLKKIIKMAFPEEEQEKKKIMGVNRFLGNTKNFQKVFLIADSIIFLFMNYLTNILSQIIFLRRDIFSESFSTGLINFLPLRGIYYFWYFYLLFAAISAISYFSFLYKVKTNYSEENFNVEQKGSSKFATIEEIQSQYRAIDEKTGDYAGMPGIMVCSYKGKHYIDDGNTNTLVIGITRAGKDEIFVQPSINDYSRSLLRPSMVIIDIKGESYRATNEILKERGYKNLVYNLSDLKHSISVNYLSNIAMLYKKEEYEAAENLAFSYSHALFAKDASDAENSFFWENASSLLAALILAQVEDCLYADRKNNAIRERLYREKREHYEMLPPDLKREAEEQIQEYQGEDFISDKAITAIPGTETFFKIEKYEKQINIYSVIVGFSEMARQPYPGGKQPEKTGLDYFFDIRPATDRAKLKYSSVGFASDRAKGDIYSSMAIRLAAFMQEGVAKISIANEWNMTDLGFGDTPIAVFLILPDYDTSLHCLASIFIQQSYYMLAKMCDEYMRCKRPVKYIINEFGNIPKIDNLSNMITVCLGRNITFDLYIQSVKRIEHLYGKDANTIMGNCGNQIYLMANDYETAEYFSKMIGNETIIDIQRTGEKLSLEKHFMERPEQKPLLDPNELLELKAGHCVIRRAMKRYDLAGTKIRPRPIYNRDEIGTTLKYRYQYLDKVLKDPMKIKMSDYAPERKNIGELKNYVYDYHRSFDRWSPKRDTEKDLGARKEAQEGKKLGDLSVNTYKMLYSIASKEADPEKDLGWDDSLPLEIFLMRVEQAAIREEAKRILLSEIKKEMR